MAVLAVPGTAVAVALQQRSLLAVTLGALLALAVNALSARRTVGAVRVSVEGPVTVTTGAGYRLRLRIEGRPATVCAVAVEGADRAWYAAGLPAAGELDLRAGPRGLVGWLEVAVRSSTPLGLVSCVRSGPVRLDSPIHVVPRRVWVAVPPSPMLDTGVSAVGGEEPVGLRPYVPGDAPRDVHWPSVARSGSIVVRDRRTPAAAAEVDVVVDTVAAEPASVETAAAVAAGGAGGAENPEAAESVLGRARSALEQLLAQGLRVRLITIEDDGGPPVASPVATATDVGVRLARAGVGRPDRPSDDSGGRSRLVISAEGLRWQRPPG